MKKICFTFSVIFLISLCFVTISISHEIQQKSHINARQVESEFRQTARSDVQTGKLLAQLQTENEKSQAEKREKLHEMIAWRLIKYLALNENQSTKFLPDFIESNKIRIKLINERRKIVHATAKDIDDESVSIKNLQKQLARIEKIDKEIMKEHENFLKKSKEILDERQYIKLKLFEDKLKNDLFQRFRGRRPRNQEENEKNNQR